MSGEKTLGPTEKRKRDAALKGDVLRSRDLATAVAMLAGAFWLKFAGPWLMAALVNGARRGLSWDRSAIDQFDPGSAMLALTFAVLPPLVVLAGSVLVAVLLVQLGPSHGRWVGANALPKASRLNPLSGLKRMFGASGWIEAAKGLAKVIVLGTLVWIWARGHVPALLSVGRRAELSSALGEAWSALTGLLVLLSIRAPNCRSPRLNTPRWPVRSISPPAKTR